MLLRGGFCRNKRRINLRRTCFGETIFNDNFNDSVVHMKDAQLARVVLNVILSERCSSKIFSQFNVFLRYLRTAENDA